MAEQKSKDITPQEDAVQEIEEREFESIEALEAFTEGDDRKKVEAAVEAKKEEFKYDPDDEDATAETVTVIAVKRDLLETVAEALAEKNAEDQRNLGSREDPSEVQKAALTAQRDIEKLLDQQDGDELELPEEQFSAISKAVAEKVVIDQELRGINQPADVDRALMEAREALEDIEDA